MLLSKSQQWEDASPSPGLLLTHAADVTCENNQAQSQIYLIQNSLVKHGTCVTFLNCIVLVKVNRLVVHGKQM